jgi:hypothetical protein
MRGSVCGSLSLSLSIIAAVQLAFLPAGRAQNAPPPGEPEVTPQGANVVPPPAPPPGPPGPQGGPPPPGYGFSYGPVVHLRSTHPRARLQVQGPLKWQDVCVAPCNVPVNPQGLYRIGGGSIRPSEGFNMPRPSGQVVIDAQAGSTVKHWVGIGLIIGGAVAAAGGTIYIAGADSFANSSSNIGGETKTAFQTIGIIYLVTGLILLGVGIPLAASSTSVEVH